MSKLSTPLPNQTASARQLIRSTLVALVVAAILLVTIVWPAEYGIDVTGAGTALGLGRMGKIKAALAKEGASLTTAPPGSNETGGGAASADPRAAESPAESLATRFDVTEIVLGPNEGKEVKLIMQKGARANYAWSAEGGVVDFETHGEPFNAPASVYQSYEKGTAVASDEGLLSAPFSGKHGWYWRNRSSSNVKVKLETRGQYREVRIIETPPTGATR